MEFQDVVRRRRMVRNFDSRPLPPELAERVVANALRGPSAGFTQGTELLVLQGTEETARYWDACFPVPGRAHFHWPGLLRAPLLVVFFGDAEAYVERYSQPDKAAIGANRDSTDPSAWPAAYWDVDAAFASLLALLTAVDAGLGALFFGVSRPDDLRAEFGIPDRFTAVGTVAVGFALPHEPSSSLARGRRSSADVVHRGHW
jgi:nitroreductase